eukprot:GHVU01156862.1.p1 GENE.GHVU01156862.1~~GHVU01156862.1.p1  ORF type:complete len:178 (-),score=7.49 GHVU01156862.1:255-788(-)
MREKEEVEKGRQREAGDRSHAPLWRSCRPRLHWSGTETIGGGGALPVGTVHGQRRLGPLNRRMTEKEQYSHSTADSAVLAAAAAAVIVAAVLGGDPPCMRFPVRSRSDLWTHLFIYPTRTHRVERCTWTWHRLHVSTYTYAHMQPHTDMQRDGCAHAFTHTHTHTHTSIRGGRCSSS